MKEVTNAEELNRSIAERLKIPGFDHSETAIVMSPRFFHELMMEQMESKVIEFVQCPTYNRKNYVHSSGVFEIIIDRNEPGYRFEAVSIAR